MADNFVDERHALYCGWVMGLTLRHELPIRPGIDEDGDYNSLLFVELPGEHLLTLVIPYPPDDWNMIDQPERNPDAQASSPAASGHAEGDALQPPQG